MAIGRWAYHVTSVLHDYDLNDAERFVASLQFFLLLVTQEVDSSEVTDVELITIWMWS
jgi:hypothetical protein